jgi:hypothetical protein
MDRQFDGLMRDYQRDRERGRWARERRRDLAFNIVAGLVAGLLAFSAVSLFLGGCASAQRGFQVALVATASTVSAAYRAADDYDRQKQADFVNEALAGKVKEAQAERSAYVIARDKALKVMGTAASLVNTGYAALLATDAGKRRDWGALTTSILTAGFQVVTVLKSWGVTLPAVLQ